MDSILQCGSSSQSIYIQADGTSTCEKLDDECWNRKYEILIPKKICEVKSQQKNVGIVPLVFAVHGYGGSPSNMLAWEEVAEDFAFVLIRPEGMFFSHCLFFVYYSLESPPLIMFSHLQLNQIIVLCRESCRVSTKLECKVLLRRSPCKDCE